MQRKLIKSRLKSKLCSSFSDWGHRFWNSFWNLEPLRDSNEVDAIELEPRTPFASPGSGVPSATGVSRQTLDFAASLGFSQTPASALETLSTSDLTFPAPKSSNYLHGSLQDLAENIARAKKMVFELNVQLNAMKQSFDMQSAANEETSLPNPGPAPTQADAASDEPRSDSDKTVLELRWKPLYRASREPAIRSCRFQKFCLPRSPIPKFRTKRLSIVRTVDWTS